DLVMIIAHMGYPWMDETSISTELFAETWCPDETESAILVFGSIRTPASFVDRTHGNSGKSERVSIPGNPAPQKRDAFHPGSPARSDRCRRIRSACRDALRHNWQSK